MKLATRMTLMAAAALLVLSAAPSVAEAHYCCVGYKARYYAHPNYRAMYRLPPPPRWSLGGHVAVQTTNQVFLDDAVVMGGMGLHLRYRGYRFGLEAAADFLGGSYAEERVSRLSVPIQLSLMMYLVPEGVFNLFLLGGGQIVPSRVRLNYPDFEREQTHTQAGFQAGGGFEVNLGHRVSFLVDIRAFGLMRLDNDEPGAFYTDVQNPVIPEKTVGVQFNMGGSIRW